MHCYTRTVLIKVNWSVIRAAADRKDLTGGKVVRTFNILSEGQSTVLSQISKHTVPPIQTPGSDL